MTGSAQTEAANRYADDSGLGAERSKATFVTGELQVTCFAASCAACMSCERMRLDNAAIGVL